MIMTDNANIHSGDAINSRINSLYEYWSLPETFISWAMAFFRGGAHLNCLVNRLEAFDSYRQCLPERERAYARPAVWKWHLQIFCKAAGWEWCPDDEHTDILKKERGDYVWRDGWSGRDVYGFYIRTSREGQ